jgi:hypothetical protein
MGAIHQQGRQALPENRVVIDDEHLRGRARWGRIRASRKRFGCPHAAPHLIKFYSALSFSTRRASNFADRRFTDRARSP